MDLNINELVDIQDHSKEYLYDDHIDTLFVLIEDLFLGSLACFFKGYCVINFINSFFYFFIYGFIGLWVDWLFILLFFYWSMGLSEEIYEEINLIKC